MRSSIWLLGLRIWWINIYQDVLSIGVLSVRVCYVLSVRFFIFEKFFGSKYLSVAIKKKSSFVFAYTLGYVGRFGRKIGRSGFLEQWGNTFQRLRTTRTTTQALNRMGWRNQCLMCLSLQVCFSSTFLKDWQESGEIGVFRYSILQSVIYVHMLGRRDLNYSDRCIAWIL